MSHTVTPGGSSPPIYEKERAVRMARKLGLRVITTSRGHGSSAEPAKATGQAIPPEERSAPQSSPGLSFTGRSNCR